MRSFVAEMLYLACGSGLAWLLSVLFYAWRYRLVIGAFDVLVSLHVILPLFVCGIPFFFCWFGFLGGILGGDAPATVGYGLAYAILGTAMLYASNRLLKRARKKMSYMLAQLACRKEGSAIR